jgi:hypothetical protein
MLGVIDEYPNNQLSWRFVNENYVFPQPNPLSQRYEEDVTMTLMNDYLNADFVGVKIGDLSGDLNGRSGGVVDLVVADEQLIQGNEYRLVINTEGFEELVGFQFTLNFDATALEYVGMYETALGIEDGNVGLTYANRGMLTLSWDDIEGMSLAEDQEAIVLRFRALSEVTVGDAIWLSSDITKAEAYTQDQRLALSMKYVGGAVEDVAFEIYQNAPNPFAEKTIIGFKLPAAKPVLLRILDVSGKLVREMDIEAGAGYIEAESW